MPLLGDPGHKDITKSLQTRIPKLLGLNTPRSPRAIILITAHWTTDAPTISSATKPDLLYDYYGFPPESYEIKFPAAGDAEIAADVAEAMTKEGMRGVKLDGGRGWDHGVFVPLKLAIPEANVPIVQVSVLASEDPEKHLRMGRALSSLREKNIAIVGSGFASFHNLRLMMGLRHANPSEGADIRAISQEWNAALNAVLDANKTVERWQGLTGWRALPGADTMHPPRGGEHFMPLLVCAGAAGEGEGTRRYKDDFMGFDIFTYYWGADEVA